MSEEYQEYQEAPELFSVETVTVSDNDVVQHLRYSTYSVFSAWRRNEVQSTEESSHSINAMIDGVLYYDLAEISEDLAYGAIFAAFPELLFAKTNQAAGVISLTRPAAKEPEDKAVTAKIQEEKSFTSWLKTLL